jgi:hypothetical protein
LGDEVQEHRLRRAVAGTMLPGHAYQSGRSVIGRQPAKPHPAARINS